MLTRLCKGQYRFSYNMRVEAVRAGLQELAQGIDAATTAESASDHRGDEAGPPCNKIPAQ